MHLTIPLPLLLSTQSLEHSYNNTGLVIVLYSVTFIFLLNRLDLKFVTVLFFLDFFSRLIFDEARRYGSRLFPFSGKERDYSGGPLRYSYCQSMRFIKLRRWTKTKNKICQWVVYYRQQSIICHNINTLLNSIPNLLLLDNVELTYVKLSTLSNVNLYMKSRAILVLKGIRRECLQCSEQGFLRCRTFLHVSQQYFFLYIVCILNPFFLFVLPDQRLYKVKFTPEQAQRGSRGIALLFL
jgi:hypothetical protein